MREYNSCTIGITRKLEIGEFLFVGKFCSLLCIADVSNLAAARGVSSPLVSSTAWRLLTRRTCDRERSGAIRNDAGNTQDSYDEIARGLVGFKVVYVFDVRQTHGEPLPEPPDWKNLEQNQEIQEKLTT